MKFPPKINPAHCASKDQTRYMLTGVALQGNMAIATEGRVLFLSTITREDDDSKRDVVVPTKAIHAERKGKTTVHSVLPLMTIRDAENEGGRPFVEIMHSIDEKAQFGDIQSDQYPDWSHVLADPNTHTKRLCINIKLLNKVAKALGEDMIELHLDPEKFGDKFGQPDGYHEAIYVTAQGQPEAVAVVMPARAKCYLGDNHALTEGLRIKQERAEARASKAQAEQPQPNPQ